jgi:hypothetical protein
MRKVYITKEPLRTEDAVRVETYFDGVKKRNLYIFNCKTCQSEIRIRKHNLRSSTGLCRGCAVSRPNLRIRLRPFEWCYRTLVRSAKERGIEVCLAYEGFLEYTNVKECHYCKGQVEWLPFGNKQRKHSVACNLDRKDGSLGYSQENLVVCCKTCNRIKGDSLTYAEMLAISPQLEVFRVKRGMKW